MRLPRVCLTVRQGMVAVALAGAYCGLVAQFPGPAIGLTLACGLILAALAGLWWLGRLGWARLMACHAAILAAWLACLRRADQAEDFPYVLGYGAFAVASIGIAWVRGRRPVVHRASATAGGRGGP